jgi:predicted acetyltransferase
MNTSHNQIEIIPARVEQKSVVANLLELYEHDFSAFLDLEIGPDGRFGYRNLDLYWTQPDRHPFLVYVHHRLAGFALIAEILCGVPAKRVWDVAEFFILRGYRRRGIGTEIGHRLWRRFPGLWEVRVMTSNEPACRFWQRAIASFAGEEIRATPFQQGGRDWRRFAFESTPATHDAGPAGGGADETAAE